MRAFPPPARPALLALLLLLGGCLDDSDRRASGTGGGSPPPPVTAIAPDYWPTTAWQTASPEAQGFAPGAFDTLAADAAAALPYHTSLLVIRNGWLLHESYNGLAADDSPITADSRHHVWSITKSVTALTVGRALTRGDLAWSQLEVGVGEALPAAATNGLAGDDPSRGIHLLDVLRMRSGLAWNEGAELMQFGKDPMYRAAMGLEPDCPSGPEQVLCGILHKPQAYTPGTVWNYSTYDSYLASGLFTALLPEDIADRRLASYADSHLFAELGIDAAATDWTAIPSAYTYGGGLLNIRSRDLGKVGLLTLYGGKWNDTQLIDPDWMTLALTAQGDGEIAAFDGSGAPSGSTATTIPYGLQWWRVTGPGLDGAPSISARGLHGQMMHILPDQELIIIITCNSSSTYDRSAEINAFLKSHIVDRLAD